ncbi:hypothetical protein [Oleispirillum naphthae]|uniref:hypothetical protein n=1 Tax=Oleispirillum naphthae TaxID=2838853 RepID=UPI003082269C
MILRPSECPVSSRDAFDMAMQAFIDIAAHPFWLGRTVLLPFVAVWGLSTLLHVAGFGLRESVWGMAAVWTAQAAAFVPCLLAWSRIGFRSAGSEPAPPPSPLEHAGLVRGLDVLVIVMAAVAGLAGLADIGLDFLTVDLPPRWLLVFAGGLVLVPSLVFGGMRLLVAVAAAAVGWPIGYAGVRVLTARRGAWLAGVGLVLLCLYPLTARSVAGIREVVGGPLGGLQGAWAGVEFGAMVALTAVCGHVLGQVLRRLVDGVPRAAEA